MKPSNLLTYLVVNSGNDALTQLLAAAKTKLAPMAPKMPRVLTDADHHALAAAQAKRERRAAKLRENQKRWWKP